MRGKKFLAFVLSLSMLMGGSIMASATGAPTVSGGDSVDAPIFSMNVLNIVVPTNMAVAFNPGELDVKNGEETVTDQVVSRNLAIVNKSSKDKVISAAIKVTDLNGTKIVFKDSEQEVTDAAADAYAVYLALAPANKTAPQTAAGNAITHETDQGDLTNVKMTAAQDVSGNDLEVPLASGDNKVEFKLGKATFTKKGDGVVLGTTSGNDVSSLYDLSALGTDGLTAFTFVGAMKATAPWEKLVSGIKIEVVYTARDAEEDDAYAADTTYMLAAAGAGGASGIKDGDTVNAQLNTDKLTFKVVLPEGATGVSAVSLKWTDNKFYTQPATIGTASNGKVSVELKKSENLTKGFLTNAREYNMKITFTDNTSTVYNCKLKVE